MFLSILINSLLAINLVVCVLLILVVLMQRPKSEGLGAAFGGGMTENLFGAQTTTVLTNITRWLGGILLGLCLILSVLYAHQAKPSSKSKIQQALAGNSKETTAAKATTPIAAAPAPVAKPSQAASAPAPVAEKNAGKPAPAPGAAASPVSENKPAQP